MGCSLLALMTVAAGYIQWQLREAATDLEAQQVEISRMGKLLSKQNVATDAQSSTLREQMDAVVLQSNQVREQAALLRTQQGQINSQADAVGSQWVVVDLTLSVYRLRHAFIRFAVTEADADLQAANAHLESVQQLQALLEMLEVAPAESVVRLNETVERCQGVLDNLTHSAGDAVSVEERVAATRSCGDQAIETLAALLTVESDRVIRNGTIARKIGEEAGRVSGELLDSVTLVQERAVAAGEAAAELNSASRNMSALGENLQLLSDGISARHHAIRETTWSAVLIAVAVGLALFAVFFRSILRPIHAQAGAMRTHARVEGSLPEAMDEDGPAELRDFAAAYNQIREVLAASAYSKHYVDNILRCSSGLFCGRSMLRQGPCEPTHAWRAHCLRRWMRMGPLSCVILRLPTIRFARFWLPAPTRNTTLTTFCGRWGKAWQSVGPMVT